MDDSGTLYVNIHELRLRRSRTRNFVTSAVLEEIRGLLTLCLVRIGWTDIIMFYMTVPLKNVILISIIV